MPLILYLREDCHLCELALVLLQRERLGDRLGRVDIDSDPLLGIEFGLRIPVLVRADGRQLDWPFDAPSLRAFLA